MKDREWRPKQKLQTNKRDSDKEGDKRPNHESQNTDAPGTTLYVLCGLQEGIQLDFPWQALGDYDDHGIFSALDWLAGHRHGECFLYSLQTVREQLAKVKVAGTLSEWLLVKKDVLSPYLFNILAQTVMTQTLDGFQGGLQIGGQIVTNFRYVDDIILLATEEAELQELVDSLDRVSRK